MTRVSVAMAVYNGEKYLDEQIKSILSMMHKNDELIISYNESNDNTYEIVKQYERQDSRVYVYLDRESSVESNFNNAVKHCNGKYIFLADQDDVWINNKIDVMVSYFKKYTDVGVLISDGYVVDAKLNINEDSIYKCLRTKTSPLLNLIKGSYLGCQMAFTNKIKQLVWPVPITNPPMAHDLWLGIIGAKYAKVKLVPEHLIMHRIHNDNCSNNRKMSLGNCLKNRIIFAYYYIVK